MSLALMICLILISLEVLLFNLLLKTPPASQEHSRTYKFCGSIWPGFFLFIPVCMAVIIVIFWIFGTNIK
jgi:hypothetical protein